MFVRSLPYVMVAVVLALTPVAVVYGYRYVTATPEFRVQNVHIEGHRQLGIEEVLETANVAHAPNILKLNLRDVEAALLAHPWVVSASVRRELPAQLFIKIVERTPVALLALDGPLYLVDKHANIFSRIETDKHFDLPVLTGLTRNDLAAEATQDRKALTRSLVRGALTLMDIWRTSSIGQRINVSEIHMDPLLGLSVILGEGAGIHRGGTVRIGRGHLQDKLERLEAIVDHAAAEGQSIAKVMLDNDIDPSRVAVSFKQPDLTTAKKDDVSKVDTEAKTGEQASPNRRPGGRSKREAKPHNVR
jgi:cell division protein FtsQ